MAYATLPPNIRRDMTMTPMTDSAPPGGFELVRE